MPGWTSDFENDLTQLLKDWLKSQGRTQADLRRSLRAVSTRLPSILEVLERDYNAKGIQGLASRLCQVENEWYGEERPADANTTMSAADPFGQLDLLLQEIRQDCSE
jgi:hypothetical protein